MFTRRVIAMEYIDSVPILNLGDEIAKIGINPVGKVAAAAKHENTCLYPFANKTVKIPAFCPSMTCLFIIVYGISLTDSCVPQKHIDEWNILKSLTLAYWERKNCFKVYETLFCISTRNFKKASSLFLHSISTFTTTYDLFKHDTFIFYLPLRGLYPWIEFPLNKR
ncbi:hypothetical protein CASFOL_042291 [Castilleja foliolosa]|uniref:26S proteasome regulatory subunit Rpn7 N-terminal domain-containing protein n=1 Tax=Castilleja foliolosa TaxID=1961234 RepID=A0ABD3BA48_9LAMI